VHWSKVQVVHCGLDPEFHRIDPLPFPVVPRLVCVGRLCEQKGQLLLVEALALLRDRGCVFELVLAGDGEMRAEIEALLVRLGLTSQVRITGWIGGDQVRAEILAARGLVLASFAEGLPVVLMEAMALRRPVLSTYVAGIPELVRPGVNGWLVAPGSVADLAAAIADLLRQPDHELQRMGEAAFERVLARHSVDIEAGRLLALFRRQTVCERSA
jgi:glycosyltransferase involved in cell wall biosynthesis